MMCIEPCCPCEGVVCDLDCVCQCEPETVMIEVRDII
jgi:hypothetical protein